MDPFLLALILCCFAGVLLQGSVILDSLPWGFIGLSVLGLVVLLIIMTGE